MSSTGICRICNTNEVRIEDGRTVCDECLGLTHPSVRAPKREENTMDQFAYHCETHGPHNGCLIGRNKSSKCPKCQHKKKVAGIRAHHDSKRAQLNNPAPVLPEPEASGMPVPNTPRFASVESAPVLDPPGSTALLNESDFAPYPGLLDTLRERAHDEVRTPALQMIWFCRMLIDRLPPSVSYPPQRETGGDKEERGRP